MRITKIAAVTIKKANVLVLLVAFLFLCVGCNTESTDDGNTTETFQETNASQISVEDVRIYYDDELERFSDAYGNSVYKEVPVMYFVNNSDYTILKVVVKRKYTQEPVLDEYIIFETEEDNIYPSQMSRRYCGKTRCAIWSNSSGYGYEVWGDDYNPLSSTKHMTDSEDYSIEIWYLNENGEKTTVIYYYDGSKN